MYDNDANEISGSKILVLLIPRGYWDVIASVVLSWNKMMRLVG